MLEITCRRGAAFESTHAVAAVHVSADGHVLDSVGPPTVTTWRSAAKPFQLEVSLSFLDPAFVAGLTTEALAIGAASHSGQPGHLALVRELFASLGRHEDDLRNGADSQIHNNCSGKHAFMIGAAAAVGLPGSDYRDPDHPVQQRIRARMDELSGDTVKTVVIDGCGVPCFVLSLQGMARAWATMAAAMADRDTDGLGAIGWAMNKHPWHVSGDNRVDLALIEAATQPIVTKVGAAGLICVALPHSRSGIALKCLTGDPDARAIGLEAVLQRWAPGLIPTGSLERWRIIRNVAGNAVGLRTAQWRDQPLSGGGSPSGT